jgi:predicted transcriptional regulator
LRGIYITLEYIEIYHEIKDLLRYTSSSSVRVKILICLSEGKQNMNEIKKETDISSSTISHNLSNLEKKKITTKEGEKYILTPFGNLITSNLIENMKPTAVITKFQKFWLNHDLSSIPPKLIKEMGDLYNSSLVESESGEIYKPHETYQGIILKSNYIKGVSSIFRFNYIELFRNIIENEIDVELILTDNIISKIMEGIDSESLKHLKNSMSQDKVKLMVINNDVRIAFTVTDKYLSLGLFHEQGDYDNTKDLISDDHDAVAWGNKLFEYYRNQSQEFEI